MSRALVTFGSGPASQMLTIALPSFRRFAEEHGYYLISRIDQTPDNYWPVPWLKVAMLQQALEHFDEALWVDADIVIVEASADVPCRAGAWQSMAVHHTQDGEVPNTGVWLVRQPMRPVLSSLWSMGEYRGHPWWEQGAVMELLGYDSWSRPAFLREATELYRRTDFLSNEWNSHPWDESDQPRFMHATMRQRPEDLMKGWARAARS